MASELKDGNRSNSGSVRRRRTLVFRFDREPGELPARRTTVAASSRATLVPAVETVTELAGRCRGADGVWRGCGWRDGSGRAGPSH